MAWHYSYDTASSRADFLSRLNTWLTATVGWTLHDDQSGGSPAYMIWRSTGEASDQEIYVRIWISTTSNRLGVSTCRYWDAATHTGYSEVPTYYASVQGMIAPEAGFVYFLLGDKNGFFMVTKSGANYYCSVATQLAPVWSSAMATTVNAESAGSDVEIEVDTVAPFEAGKTYQIMNFNSATGVPELVTVSSVGASSITVAALANNHAAGARIGELPGRMFIGVHQSSSLWDSQYAWTKTGTQNTTVLDQISSLIGKSDPDSWAGYYWLAPIFVSGSTQELPYGSVPNVYNVGLGVLASEDTIVVNGVTYKFFNCYSGRGLAIKQG